MAESTINTYNIRDVDVRFPFSAYPCQLVYMEKVIEALQNKSNALLESPTGTGKTLCLLCACLGWLEAEKNKARQQTVEATPGLGGLGAAFGAMAPSAAPPPKIVYASRTHSQLSQVVHELRGTGYTANVCVLGSRKQLCVHEKVSKLGGSAQNAMCRQLTEARRCSYHNAMQESGPADAALLAQEMLDIEELAEAGKAQGKCPYFLSREMQAEADLVLMPYNYLISPLIRASLKVDLSGAVVIFDEGHNLEASAGDASSFEVRTFDLGACVGELDYALHLFQVSAVTDLSSAISREDIAILKTVMLELEAVILELPLVLPPAERNTPARRLYADMPGRVEDTQFMIDLLAKVSLKKESYLEFCTALDEVVSLITSASSAGRGPARTSALSSFKESVVKMFSKSAQSSADFKVYIAEDTSRGGGGRGGRRGSRPSFGGPSDGGGGASASSDKPGRIVGFWCFSPGVAVQDLVACSVRNIILTSGTLTPLSSFAQEMKTPFQVTLENPHVISAAQVWVAVLRKGPSGHVLNSSYNNRSNVSYINDLGATIANVARIVPSGVLVFFPSYSVMLQCMDVWQQRMPNASSSMWETISRHKTPFVEPRGSGDLNAQIDEFYAAVRSVSGRSGAASGAGAIFFAVCRGKVSEGLDFADANGRAVVVTGLPYPNTYDPKVKLKRKFLDEKMRRGEGKLSGGDWYSQQASRAVNQAIGRVIRHKDDYGAILLCDERFARRDNLNQLPLWLRAYTQVFASFGEATRGLTQFFRYVKTQPFFEISAARAARPAKSDRSGRPARALALDAPRSSLAQSAPPAPDKTLPGVSRRKAPYAAMHFTPPPATVPAVAAATIPLAQAISAASAAAAGPATQAHQPGLLRASLASYRPSETSAASPAVSVVEKLMARKRNAAAAAAAAAAGGPRNPPSKELVHPRKTSSSLSASLMAAEPAAAQREQQSQDFISLARSLLSKAEYKAMKSALRAFARDKSHAGVIALIDAVWPMFAVPGRKALLSTFATFIPLNHQAEYLQRVHAHLLASPDEPKKRPRSPALSPHASPAKKPRRGCDSCVVCGAAPNTPFRAPCGHVGCHACWVATLGQAVTPCPACAAPTRVRELAKQYF
ncbi:tumor necrosis factor receptor superfamily member 6B [Thecamonas trahens ATCC 50062]|uniref:Regulator of telomere elongation helicase 1 homolog n=1 Tax=Thecamonas trahens ATCC 50062 TaxID=461836 RepID=A0A0L0DJ17_THETB|nr:tumor necrosis factor receptor superfamily member 6B [Thecamonas trahens ATCC 50062]KNC52066.1 tumor necrosis factor receptor superfamily member 6B [Thecamonas trahens ATCC 50062]|eukprot:XP_013762071.1 tumor necrosis factor receptor superfamily member 6B [Thecamonas trahens ATCC 50062]